MSGLAFQNGRFLPASDLSISFADAGFVQSATVTDFCRTYRRRLFRWLEHLARFRRDCETLRIPLTLSDSELTSAAERLVRENALGEVAVVTFATPGPLGYLVGSTQNGPPTLGMHTLPISRERYRRFFSDGVSLAIAGTLDSGIVPVSVKHRSRLHWWLAEHPIRDLEPGAVPILLDASGAPDSAIGSVLAVVEGCVVAPLPGSVLAGVSVGVVRDLARRIGREFREDPLDFRNLPEHVSEVLLTGSGFGIAGVRRLTDGPRIREFPWPGPVFRDFLTAWSDEVGMAIDAEFLEVTHPG